MSKELKDHTFEELVDYFSQRTHSMLLEEGGKGLKSGVYLAMEQAIRWFEAQEKKKAGPRGKS